MAKRFKASAAWALDYSTGCANPLCPIAHVVQVEIFVALSGVERTPSVFLWANPPSESSRAIPIPIEFAEKLKLDLDEAIREARQRGAR